MDTPVTESHKDADYFITADAGFCHILPDQLIITPLPNYSELPPVQDKKNFVALLFGSLGVAFGTFLMINFFRVGFYLMGVMFFAAMFYAVKVLGDVARYTIIRNIPRNRIISIVLRKPSFGYHYLLIAYTRDSGKTGWRKIKLYDSVQNEEHAQLLLKQAGLLTA
ncbi:MAG TPA: hypothetical protein VNZ86_09390 [Bacteroidia bacterium]|jgi:hypothetical protein|nr:hypothetical protein [Bacteroidia bacterium]